LLIATGLLFAASISFAAQNQAEPPSNELREPPVFTSARGVLDLLMIARPAPITLADLKTIAWVYEVCPRSVAKGDICPQGSQTFSPYGGVRLQLEPGDHLCIRLVNDLPPAPPDATYAAADPAMLAANPTNLHTHGLLVSPHTPTKADPTYGDYVYVLEYPAGKQPKMQMPGMTTTGEPIQYDIFIPRDHPSGLYWFHPHSHGLSQNQIAHGMGGILTIGEPSDYLELHGQQIRHLVLKDIQVEKNGTVLSQEDSRFCHTFAFPGEPARYGSCGGTIEPSGTDYTGGKWIFSVNGQVYPTITVGDRGDVWRITNASADVSYLLKLIDDGSRKALPFHVVATDGVGTALPMGMPIQGAMPAIQKVRGCENDGAICTTELLVMPASRVEVFVPPQDGSSKTATLQQASYGTGPAGDSWPMANLAKVVFSAVPTDVPKNDAPLLRVKNWKAPPPEKPATLANAQATADQSCRPLAPGHRRRIFFGIPKTSLHGLGYEEVDEKGQPVPGSFRDIVPFEHGSTTVCLPLATSNAPVTETWELVNVSGEDHNFHIHQTRFKVLTDAGSGDDNLYMDSVIVPHGSWGCDGTVQHWRRGACTVKPILVAIRFTQPGDFVYHCHILSHGDAGMMAHIRVLANASSDLGAGKNQ
jgi:FtsP/CotA-like multicopper oxidase with cupredoxin domain